MKIKKQTQKTRLTSIRYGWLVVMVSLGLFTSCSKNEDANKLPYGKYPIAVMAEVDGQVLTRVAGKDAWANDDVMAMKIGDVTKKYIFNATTGKFSCADPFYWGSSTEKMTVDAWYPYSDVKTADVDIRVKADQSTEANYLESDLLEVDGGVISLVNDKVTFRHRTSKVVINLTAKQGIDISTVGVAITNLSGVETGTDVKPHKNGNTYTALLVPQNSSGKGFIKVTFKGVDYTYIPKTNEASFTAGKQYTYNIAVDITGLTVTVNGATLWEQEGGVNNVQSA
ncbi:MAG: fimbrillin family protein, partial [Rikenellaceae bacterium]